MLDVFQLSKENSLSTKHRAFQQIYSPQQIYLPPVKITTKPKYLKKKNLPKSCL